MDAYRKYKALMFSVGKRYADRWQAQVSYVLLKVRGHGQQHVGRPVRPQPLLRDADARARQLGRRLTNDRPHEIKAFVGYEIPKIEVSVNAMYRFISGRTYAPFQQYSSTPDQLPGTAYYWGLRRRASAVPRSARQPPPAEGAR